MNTRYWLVRILVFPIVLLALLFSARTAMAQGGIVEDNLESEPYGTFNGVDYVRYSGEFAGTAAGDYSVPFEIVAPADPAQGNGVVVVEPFHPLGGAIGREAYLTPEFLFELGFSYAGIGWHPNTVDPFGGYSSEEAVEIIHSFAKTLREDSVAVDLVGEVQKLYAVGVSLTCGPLHDLLDSPGKGLLDLTFLMGPVWPTEGYDQPPDTKNIIVFLAEADLVLSKIGSFHTDALRGSSPTYRSYEVAGGPHIPDAPILRALGAQMGLNTAGTLDWTPVARALFVAGHRWAMEEVEPPPSAYLSEAPEGEIDPVYKSQYGLELATGIARGGSGNARGGIRMPDLELGRWQFIAVDPESWGGGLLGSFVDLKCEPLPDRSTRFPDHESYVSQFTLHAQTLVEQGFLLQADAERLIAAATASNVGDAEACLPTSLPESGQEMSDGLPIALLTLAGLIMIAAGLILRERIQASR